MGHVLQLKKLRETTRDVDLLTIVSDIIAIVIRFYRTLASTGPQGEDAIGRCN
jgi:hypothetical protein